LKLAVFGVQVAALLIEKRIGDRVWGVGDRKKIKKAKIVGCHYLF
jgi:hypothetical protein